ncbi:MAG: hypothetical protein Q7R68_06635 [Nitrospirales bacterium]|nr:hypothetical protein [Nitrospirales bacterium]
MPRAKPKPEDAVSVIGGQLFQSITDLIGRMVARPYQKPDQVSSNYYEGGYAAAIIVMLAVAVESMVARDRYFNPRARGYERKAVPEYMREVHRYRRYVRLSELFVLRDAIVHNHVWKFCYVFRPQGGRRLVSALRVSWSGDGRLRERLNPKDLRTKLLRANVIPMRMDRKDVLKTFEVALDVFSYLSERGAKPVRIAKEIVGFRGKPLPFSKLREMLAGAL